MALKDFVLPRRTLQVGTTEVSLRGLTFVDLGVLVAEHREEFMAAGRIISASGENMGSLASVLAQTAPGLVAHAVALAADEPDARDDPARRDEGEHRQDDRGDRGKRHGV